MNEDLSMSAEASEEEPLHTFKVLDLSTGHLTKRDNEHLLNLPMSPAIPTGAGWIVSTACETFDRMELSEQFHKIIEVAKQEGYDYVWFDQDGDFSERFEIFDW